MAEEEAVEMCEHGLEQLRRKKAERAWLNAKTEEASQTITDVADGAARRHSKARSSRQTAWQRPGPQTFFNGVEEQRDERLEDHAVRAADARSTKPKCDSAFTLQDLS